MLSKPTDPDQLAITLFGFAADVRDLPDQPADAARDLAETIAHLARLCAAEADRSPAARMRDLAALHVADHERMVRASS